MIDDIARAGSPGSPGGGARMGSLKSPPYLGGPFDFPTGVPGARSTPYLLMVTNASLGFSNRNGGAKEKEQGTDFHDPQPLKNNSITGTEAIQNRGRRFPMKLRPSRGHFILYGPLSRGSSMLARLCQAQVALKVRLRVFRNQLVPLPRGDRDFV
jgi:hypothetical protein